MDDVSVPPNCQQTVLTIIESSLFLQIISKFEPFSNLFSNLFLNNSVAIFGKFIRDFGKNKTILKRFKFNFNMNFPFHIFWINKYFHYNILIPIQKRKKIQLLFYILHLGLRTVRRQFLNEVWNMFEVRKFGNPRGRPGPIIGHFVQTI